MADDVEDISGYGEQDEPQISASEIDRDPAPVCRRARLFRPGYRRPADRDGGRPRLRPRQPACTGRTRSCRYRIAAR